MYNVQSYTVCYWSLCELAEELQLLFQFSVTEKRKDWKNDIMKLTKANFLIFCLKLGGLLILCFKILLENFILRNVHRTNKPMNEKRNMCTVGRIPLLVHSELDMWTQLVVSFLMWTWHLKNINIVLFKKRKSNKREIEKKKECTCENLSMFVEISLQSNREFSMGWVWVCVFWHAGFAVPLSLVLGTRCSKFVSTVVP